MSSRRDELARSLAQTEARIEAACDAAGRAREDVHLIVVTKFFPASDVELLVDLGVTDIGESRDQEAGEKVAELRTLVGERLPRVHFVGQLQRNKAASVASYADVVHSVDRERLAVALEKGAERSGRQIDVLLQVDLDPDPDPDRGGLPPAEVGDLADRLTAYPSLRLRGVMAVAPLGADPAEAFGRLAVVSETVRAAYPDATVISAGMSADLEQAIAGGATHLRVGTAILGSRPSHR